MNAALVYHTVHVVMLWNGNSWRWQVEIMKVYIVNSQV